MMTTMIMMTMFVFKWVKCIKLEKLILHSLTQNIMWEDERTKERNVAAVVVIVVVTIFLFATLSLSLSLTHLSFVMASHSQKWFMGSSSTANKKYIHVLRIRTSWRDTEKHKSF